MKMFFSANSKYLNPGKVSIKKYMGLVQKINKIYAISEKGNML